MNGIICSRGLNKKEKKDKEKNKRGEKKPYNKAKNIRYKNFINEKPKITYRKTIRAQNGTINVSFFFFFTYTYFSRINITIGSLNIDDDIKILSSDI